MTDPKPPLISVIIPSLNRPEALRALVDDLLKQDYPAFEIIAVDQSDQPNAELINLAGQEPRLRYLKTERTGTPNAKNEGLAVARGEIVFFLDDDTRIDDPSLLQTHADNYSDESVMGVGGRVADANRRLNRAADSGRTCWVDATGKISPNATGHERVDINAPRGGHVSYRAEAIRAVKGFDEQFVGNAMREETDLSLRVLKTGGLIVFEPRATVTHLGLLKGGTRSFDRRKWYEDFFANELYFFMKHFKRRYLPWLLGRLLRPILVCAFYYGRGRWSWATTPIKGFHSALKRYAKVSGQSPNHSIWKRWPSILLALGLAAAVTLAASKFGTAGWLAGLGFIFFLIIAYTTLRAPFVGLLILTFLLPFERVGSVELAGFTVRASQVVGALLLFSWVLWLFIKRPRLIRPNPAAWATFIFLIIALLSVSQAVNQFRAVSVLLFVAFTMAVGWMVPQLLRTTGQLKTVIRVLLLVSGLIGVFGLFQFLGDLAGLPTGLTGLRDLYTSEVFGFPRVQSTFLEPLYYANFLLIPISLGVAFLLSGVRLIKPFILGGLILLMLLNLGLTLSRGGYIALAATLLVLGIAYLSKILTPHRLILLIVAAGIVVWGVTQFLAFTGDKQETVQTFTKQATGIFTGASYFDRAETFSQAWDLYRFHPWLGVGIGNFGPAVALYPLIQPDSGWLIVNNEFLELMAETGTLGFLSFLVLLVVLFIRTLRASLRSADPFIRSVNIGLLAAFVGVIVQYQTFSILYIMHVWFLFGLMVAAQNLGLRIENSELRMKNYH